MSRRFGLIFGGRDKHTMIQRRIAIAGIFILTVLAIAGCMRSASPQEQVTEIDPDAATEQITLKVDGMV